MAPTVTGLTRALARPDRSVTVGRLDGIADEAAIVQMFDDTVLLGAGFDRRPAGFDTYRHLCLGWYLGPGRDDIGVAASPTGEPVGYALVCTDEAAATRWAQRSTARAITTIAGIAVRGGLDAPARRFYAARLRDLVALARERTKPPAGAHAHLNVAAGARQGAATLALVEHIDRVCRSAGHDTWYGEMNERIGRRRRPLERLGFVVVRSTPNHTLTSALGEPIERLTLVRTVPDARPEPGRCQAARRG